MKLIFNSKNIIIISCIYIFLIIFNSGIQGAELEASHYQIFLKMNQTKDIVSENIIIETKNSLEKIEMEKNIYLDRFRLVKIGGEEILPEYIEIETPFIKKTLADQHRFLIMKKDENKSWFKVRILSDAVYSSPGEYKADIFINELDWQISLNIKVESFTIVNLSDNKFSINIDNPSDSNFYISQNLYKFNIDTNHTDWEISAFLEYGGLYSDSGHYLSAEKVFYYFENSDKTNNSFNLTQEKFNNFNENKSINLISGDQYNRGFDSIRFAILLGENWSCQPAGLYRGTIIFTIITDD